MQIKPLKLDGTFEIIPNRIGDARGYFMETYSRARFAALDLQIDWVQENQSLSQKKDTLRGLHFQAPPFAQAKLVSVAAGAVLDVFVDLRSDSKTRGHWDSIVLSTENSNSVLIPRGFAHGFRTLSENTIVQYKVDNIYSHAHEDGLCWNDPDFAIDWQTENPILSEKDEAAQFYRDFSNPF